jgi:hypothetical protein
MALNLARKMPERKDGERGTAAPEASPKPLSREAVGIAFKYRNKVKEKIL